MQAPKEQTRVRKDDPPQHSASTNSAWQLGHLPWERSGDDPQSQTKDNNKSQEISDEMLELVVFFVASAGLVIGGVIIIIFMRIVMVMGG